MIAVGLPSSGYHAVGEYLPPTGITLNSVTVSVAGGVNAVVGLLETLGGYDSQSFTYSLVAGTGDTDNASFNISGSNLRANNATTLGVGTYSVRIQTSDGVEPYAEAFTINVVEPGSGSLYEFNSFLSGFRLRF